MRTPFFFSVDIVGRCNLACPSCPQGNSPVKLARDVMSPELLEQILVKAKGEATVFGVGLFNWTEPFLHPDLPAMVRTVNKQKLLCYLSTNLNCDRNLQEVLDEEPHEIRISCSGFTQPIYSRTHTKGNIERVKWNMSRLSLLRSKRTRVHLLWHQYKHNQREEALMRNFCKCLGIEFRTVQAYYMPLESVLDVWEGAGSGEQGARSGERGAGSGKNEELLDNLITPIGEHKRLCGGRKMACRNQTQEITIDAGGRVQLCCGVYDPNRFTLGNFLELPLERIQAARFSHSFCDRCLAAGGHVYVAGFSHSNPSVVRESAKKIYGKIAPLVPGAVLRRLL